MTHIISRRTFLTSASLGGAGLVAGRWCVGADNPDDPLAPWQKEVKIAPVSNVAGRHTMHCYYLVNPESPDGRRVVFYASTEKSGNVGQVIVKDRATGKETILADAVHTEDAHRVALQQWTMNGTAVAYHEVVDKRWRVVVVDVATDSKRIIAEDRQLGFGRGDGHTLPLYGCHWNPGEHRDLELFDLATGQLRTACRMDDVEKKYADWIASEFKGQRTSIAFPTISPDHRRAFFKIAAGHGGDDYVGKVSHREGIVFCDLESGAVTCLREKWGHPAWHPDAYQWIQTGNFLFDADGRSSTRIPNVPVLRGQHLAVSPDGRLWVQDGLTTSLGGPQGEWAVMVADIRGGRFQIIQKFQGDRGARSWRGNHPHPVFSADGRRLYYNVNAGEFAQLFVAEVA